MRGSFSCLAVSASVGLGPRFRYKNDSPKPQTLKPKTAWIRAVAFGQTQLRRGLYSLLQGRGVLLRHRVATQGASEYGDVGLPLGQQRFDIFAGHFNRRFPYTPLTGLLLRDVKCYRNGVINMASQMY